MIDNTRQYRFRAESPRDHQPRIAMYSHDAQGLGHVRRNLLIARALAGPQAKPVVLLLSGVREAAAFDMPSGVDCLTLPSFGKDEEGIYSARSLGLTTPELVNMRRHTISAALKSFDPDVFIVDKIPLGVFDELESALQGLKSCGRTRIILGLREILDSPDRVRADWDATRFEWAVREYFDKIWIYGDPKIFDTVAEYQFPADLAAKSSFTGYLNPFDVPVSSVKPATNGTPSPNGVSTNGTPTPNGVSTNGTPTTNGVTTNGTAKKPMALCVVGGGRDGLPLAMTFLKTALPNGWRGILVTGPLMDAPNRDMLHQLASQSKNIEVLEFVTNPLPLIEEADLVVAMGGYNTMCEVVSCRKRAIIIPRVKPRREQHIRAERFAAAGLIDLIEPDTLTPARLADCMRDALRRPPVCHDTAIDMNATHRLAALLEEVLNDDLLEQQSSLAAR